MKYGDSTPGRQRPWRSSPPLYQGSFLLFVLKLNYYETYATDTKQALQDPRSAHMTHVADQHPPVLRDCDKNGGTPSFQQIYGLG